MSASMCFASSTTTHTSCAALASCALGCHNLYWFLVQSRCCTYFSKMHLRLVAMVARTLPMCRLKKSDRCVSPGCVGVMSTIVSRPCNSGVWWECTTAFKHSICWFTNSN